METGIWGLTLEELENAVQTADPAALLVPPRILRRVIKHDRQVPGPGLRVPHRKTYVVGRNQLLSIADRPELGLPPTARLPERVILLSRPERETLLAMTRNRALVKYWRLLFHARVHVALDDLRSAGGLGPETVRARIQALGSTVFEEVRLVLRGEDMLLPPGDDAAVYEEFIAVFLELRYFAPGLLASYFPTINDYDAVLQLVCQDVDAASIYDATQLPGAVQAADEEPAYDDAWAEVPIEPGSLPRKPSERTYCRIMERADRARARGNLVRSAMLRWQASKYVGAKLGRSARSEARGDLERLARRLRAAIELPEHQVAPWATALAALLPAASERVWTAEARLLYDLQKVCVDHERGVYKLDLTGWLRTFGRAPLRRPLPAQGRVLLVKHLHAAQQRLKNARISPRTRESLSVALHAAVAASERRLADALRPLVARALDDVGLEPRNLPERVAQHKLVEELIDRVVDRGYLSMSDFRDALSRNNLKLRDVGGLDEFLSGDQLLRADRQLAESLDGVYRRGEVYLRLPQRLSSLAFGTGRGRFITLYGILPFGGAFIILEALQHIQHLVADWTTTADEALPVHHKDEVLTWPGMLLTCGLGLLLLGLMYDTRFRQACLAGWRSLYSAGHWMLVDMPRSLLELAWVRRVIDSRAFKWFGRYAFKPLLFSGMLIGVLSLVARHELSLLADLGIFLGMNLLLNSRLGRNVDELVTDWVMRSWHHLRMRVFAAVFRFIMDAFHQLLEAIERCLYTVDEWLRFRSGESRLTVANKAVLGIVWAVFAYVVRAFVNLLIEPQINPIKHFPVVTVSHKVIAPVIGVPLAQLLSPLGPWAANTIAATTALLLPGVFGFLVWELKENWRLYAANRRPMLGPVLVGRHGETIVRLLRPGFHSGTLPKLFAKLRRADRKGLASGKWTAARKVRSSLERELKDVRHFVERELIVLLELSGCWPAQTLRVGRIRLGSNSVRCELHTRDEEQGLVLCLEERGGLLIASREGEDWLARRSAQERQSLEHGITGLLKMSGAELRARQLAGVFEPPTCWEIADAGIVARPFAGALVAAYYEVGASEERMTPKPVAGLGVWTEAPVLERRPVVFSADEIAWVDWIRLWQSTASAEQPAAVAPCRVEAQPLQ